jgi:hypothetical protein
MTSACSRWSQPSKTAISNWNGSTAGVYARDRRSNRGTLRHPPRPATHGRSKHGARGNSGCSSARL